MEYRIAEGYYPVTLTKRVQFWKAKQFYKKIRQHKENRQLKNKIRKFFPSCQLHVQS